MQRQPTVIRAMTLPPAQHSWILISPLDKLGETSESPFAPEMRHQFRRKGAAAARQTCVDVRDRNAQPTEVEAFLQCYNWDKDVPSLLPLARARGDFLCAALFFSCSASWNWW